MMPQTKQARQVGPGLPFPDARGGSGGDTIDRSAQGEAEGARTVRPAAARTRAHARPKDNRTGVVTMIPYLAVVVCVVAGVYISWHQGSHGGGTGGVIAAGAFFVAAVIRLTLPAKLAGFLASRSRVTDAVTLVAFGVCLLVLGLLLPRLREG